MAEEGVEGVGMEEEVVRGDAQSNGNYNAEYDQNQAEYHLGGECEGGRKKGNEGRNRE